ncbi:peroxisomal membrane protein 11-3 [Elaeis guineensis]|uniref:Peroxisomal membrane protein 11-3 n=1 Tax=Elaeis guineensis var. tenera TaxID=51953 RepID=A0A6I9QAQ6_ELAGV|nr:peroxisomal membrane protein 11-3 [Elaeis guineensis]
MPVTLLFLKREDTARIHFQPLFKFPVHESAEKHIFYLPRCSAESITEEAKPSQNPKPPPPPPAVAGGDRDFLLHLEAYLARRDGVDKLLKISRYAAKIVLSTTLPSDSLSPRLRAFESSVGLSHKAFRLGKFVHDVNALRATAGSPASADLLLAAAAAAAYGGEGLYFFLEQFVWLSKAGLIPSEYSRRLHKVGAWAELVAHFGSVALKAKELRKIRSCLTKSMDGKGNGEELRKLREKLLLQEMWLVQDLADSLMVIADVSDGKGFLSNPLLMASVAILSALIGTYKNWISC